MYPHLPYDYPKAVILNPNTDNETRDFFVKRSIDIIYSLKASHIQSSVAYHPDMQVCHISEKLYVCAPEFFDYYKEKLTPYGVEILKGSKEVYGNYPEDIAYNVLRVGKTSFMKVGCTDEVCLFHLNKSQSECVDVSQGYAKCNGCILDENSLITSDISIYKKATENNLDALLISNGDIRLEGFGYGFVGGASFKIDKNTLCFTGDVSRHKDYKKIVEFASDKNIDIISVTKADLEDFGSVILVF